MRTHICVLLLLCLSLSFTLRAASEQCHSLGIERPIKKYKIGNNLLIKDAQDNWHKATVIDIASKGCLFMTPYEIKVHFDGRDAMHDEWIILSRETMVTKIRLWNEKEELGCPICFETTTASNFKVLHCSHSLCFDCRRKIKESALYSKTCHMCRARYTEEDLK